MSRLRFLTASLVSSFAIWSMPMACSSSAPSSSDGGGTASENYDGAWNVSVSIQSCYSFAHTSCIQVTNGTFSHYLFTYCANAKNGAARLGDNSGCGGDIEEQVSISGVMSAGKVQGNLFLNGTGCNGGNGFDSFIDSNGAQAVAGTAWGQVVFSKGGGAACVGGPDAGSGGSGGADSGSGGSVATGGSGAGGGGGSGGSGCPAGTPFACGPSLTCEAPSQYCLVNQGVSPVAYSCETDMLGCACTVSCACVPQHIGCASQTCGESGGAVTVTCT